MVPENVTQTLAGTLALLQNNSQSCVHQHTCSRTTETHDPGICPTHWKTRCFPIICPCCPLLPHSSSAYPIKSPESHPFTLCHLSSIIITLRFSCRVGLWEAATDRKQKPTETPEKNHSFSWKSRFQRAAFPARGRVLLIQRTGEEKHCTSFHASTQKTQWEPRPGNCVACPPQQVLDLKGRPKARPQGRESAQGKPDESARSH